MELPVTAAWKVQALAAVAAVAVVVWAWWHRRAHPSHLGLQVAVLCSATLLAVPMAYSYDLVLLMPAAAWIWADMKGRGASVTEVAFFAAAIAAMLPLKAIAGATHFQYGPLISLVLVGVAVFRLYGLRRQGAAC